MKRCIGLVTTARSEWGIQRPVAEALRDRNDVDLHIIAGGMHLSQAFDHTIDQIVADGFEIAHQLDYLQVGDTPECIASSMGKGVVSFAKLFGRWRPDLLTVLGDRFDMYPAVVAATPFLIPIAHMHGGEVTLGAFDDSLRHSMTKMSHLHLVSTETYARRVRQLGEDPRYIHVVGAPGLDDLSRLDPADDNILEREYGFVPGQTNVLVIHHPETRAWESTGHDAEELFTALKSLDANFVIIRPNADTANSAIQNAITEFCQGNERARTPVILDRRLFLSVMRAAAVMIGNSSAGIVEAPSFRIPVVNIGQRQAGRVRAQNVIDCPAEAGAIRVAIEKALSPVFKASLAKMRNPYGDGQSAERIADILATFPLDRELMAKRFIDF